MHRRTATADTVGTINESLGNVQFLLSKTDKRISAEIIEKRENKHDKQFQNLQQADITSILCDYETLTIIKRAWFHEPKNNFDPLYVR